MDVLSIEVRSNINSEFNDVNRIVKEREAKAEEERKARYAAENAERDRLRKEWESKHPNLHKYTYISYYNYETYSYAGLECKIYFYEWSNVNSTPRYFKTVIPFYKFLDECGITLSDSENALIRRFCNVDGDGCFIVCKPNCKELAIGGSYEEMCLGSLLPPTPSSVSVGENKDNKPYNSCVPTISNLSCRQNPMYVNSHIPPMQ